MISDMIFEIKHLFYDYITVGAHQYHGQDLLAEKTMSVTLNDINSRNEDRASS